MGQHPIAIRIKVARPDTAHDEHVVVGVSEAARRLKVSERTVYRMLKSGELERGKTADNTDSNDAIAADIAHNKLRDKSHNSVVRMSISSDNTDIYGSNGSGNATSQLGNLQRQVEAKDAQIAQLLAMQQELTRSVQRLHEQMYELAHLVLTHNVAAAQAKAEAELNLQQVQAQGKGGLAGLLGNKGRKT